MEFPALIIWTSLFPFWGLLGGIFHFIQILIGYSVSKQWRPWSDAGYALLAYVQQKGR